MLMKTQRAGAAEIAASVTKTAEHDDIERQVAEMKAKRNALNDEMKAIYREGPPDRSGPLITSVSNEIKVIEDAMRPLRQRLGILREDHGRRIAEAMVPLRSDIASKLISLIDEIEPEGRALDETTVVIERAGHIDMRQRVAMPWFAQLREQLARLVQD